MGRPSSENLPRIIHEAKTLGYTRVGVTTNGTVLSKSGFVMRLVDAGLDFIEVSVHGHTPELANAISQSNITFDRQAKALGEIEQAGDLLTIVNVVVCEENKDHLLDVAKYLCTDYPSINLRFKFKFVSLQGSAVDAAEERAALDYRDVDFLPVAAYLQAEGRPFWFYNVPLYHLGDFSGHSHELATLSVDETYFDLDHRGDEGYYDSGYQLGGHVWPERSCGSCTLLLVCPGMEESHRRANSDAALETQAIDPLPAMRFALRDRGLDANAAEARLAALKKEPRPAQFKMPRIEGALRLRHDEEKEALDLVVENRKEGARAFHFTPRFGLSYRQRHADGEQAPPRLIELLEHAREALEAADAAGDDLSAAQTKVLEQLPAGWSLADVSRVAVPPSSATGRPRGLRLPVLG